MKLNIEIDMATLGFEQDPETGDLYPTDDLVGRVAEIIASRITGYDIRSTVESEVRNVAHEKAEAVIVEVLAGTINKTDGYGHVKETTTVPAMVMAALDDLFADLLLGRVDGRLALLADDVVDHLLEGVAHSGCGFRRATATAARTPPAGR